MDSNRWRTGRRAFLLAALLGVVSACRAPALEPIPPAGRGRTAATSSRLPPRVARPTIPTPTPAPPQPTPTPVPPRDPFLILTGPLVAEAQRRRAARAAADSSYARRIDPDLNRDRINFFLLGYGQTYEPPYRGTIGSPTVLSLHLPTRSIDLVSLTHDLRAPEIEIYQKARGFRPDPTKIDQAYTLGGFDLMRLVMEDATGFAIDFQAAMDDQAVAGFVDQVMGTLDLDLPADVDTRAYVRDGKLQPAGHFSAGPNHLDGERTLAFMKAISFVHDPATERNVRKALVFGAIFAYLQAHATDPVFWLRTVDFANREVGDGHLHADFDLAGLVLANVSDLARGMISLARADGKGPLMPHLGRSLYVVDVASGDGGAEWVSLSFNPIARRDLAHHVYPDLSFEIPLASNPYADDLAADYWWSVRATIANGLLGRPLSALERKKEAAQVAG